MATVVRGRTSTLLAGRPYLGAISTSAAEAALLEFYFGAPTVDLTLVAPATFDSGATGIVLTGSLFGASQGAGTVELGDASDYATATKAAQTVTAWADTSITITANIGTLAPPNLWLFVTNNAGQRTEGRPVTVHRAAAFTATASANIAAGGADATTARLTAPGGKTTADFAAGRRVDDSATTPSTTTPASDYTEHEWSLSATGGAVAGQTYQFRVVYADGTSIATYTVTPQFTISSGATTFPVSVAGTLTSAGAPAKQARRAIPLGGASLPPAGVLARSTNKALVGAVTSAGTTTLVRAILRAFAGTLTSSGVATRSTAKATAGTATSSATVTRSTTKPLAGAITSSGALTRAKVALLALAGAMGSAGALTRRPGKALAGSIASSSTLATVRTFARAFAGTLTTSATVTRSTAKAMAGTLGPSGAVTRAKVALLALAGTLTSSATLARQVGKPLAGAVATAGQVTRQPRKVLAGAVTSSATMTRAKVALLALSGSLGSAGTVTRRTGKTLAAGLAPAGDLIKRAAKAFAGALTSAGATSATSGAAGLWSWFIYDGAAQQTAVAEMDGQPTTTDVVS